MTALWIILGIIVFFIALFSIRFTFSLSYYDTFNVSVKWLFIKHTFLPRPKVEEGKEKKRKKPKKEKEDKKKKIDEEKPKEVKEKKKEIKEEKKETKEKPQEENMLITFYNNQGFSGVIKLVNDAASAISGMFKSIFKHIVFRELKLYLTVGAGDSAETAILYGKTCSAVFPALALITTTCKVKDYHCDVQPNFMQAEKSAAFSTVISVRPIFITNAMVVFSMKMLFKVGLKLLLNSTAKSEKKTKKDSADKKTNNSQGGK